ncbi:hypothetical protein SAMN05518845_115218 [Variovorax sp. YR750]|nr:hypothetical protein SAMN05518845_115218 [Variovorax sp. YR750]
MIRAGTKGRDALQAPVAERSQALSREPVCSEPGLS